MKTIKTILKINSSGELVEFNERLKRWEASNRAWSWSDITPKFLKESKANYKTIK